MRKKVWLLVLVLDNGNQVHLHCHPNGPRDQPLSRSAIQQRPHSHKSATTVKIGTGTDADFESLSHFLIFGDNSGVNGVSYR